MNKSFKILIAVFLLLLVVMGIFEINKKPTLDWRKTFNVESKSPFGLYIFNQEIDYLFQKKLERSQQSPYNFYDENPNLAPHNILVIEKNLDQESWNKIITEVDKGSNAMIFVRDLNNLVKDTLKVKLWSVNYNDLYFVEFTDPKLKKDTLNITKSPDDKGFTKINTHTEILGNLTAKDSYGNVNRQANFIKIKMGKGNIYLHSEPLVLTNYYLLQTKSKYVESVFSYLPNQKTIWFLENESVNSNSPLKFILANPPLRYALYLLIVGLLVFTFFNAKRKQRIVPIKEPIKNSSLEFVKNIGNLYLQEGDFHDMMAKKSLYFLNRVRMELLLDTTKLDAEFVDKLHLKTGQPTEKIRRALQLIKKSQDPYAQVMQEELEEITTLLDSILT